MRAFAIDRFRGTGFVRELVQPVGRKARVRVEAASINPADLGYVSGAYKDVTGHHFPLVPGLDVTPAAFVAAGTLGRPAIRTVPLEAAGKALAEIAGRHVRGKLVATP